MKPLHIAGAIAVTAMWGGNYIAAKTGMLTFGPFFYTALRFCIVAAALLPFAPLPTKREALHLAGLGFVLCLLHMAVMILAVHAGLSVAASVIVSQMGVPFSCLLGAVLLGDVIGKWRSLGLLISFAGIFMLAGSPDVLENPVAFGFALIGAFAWGVSNIQLKFLPSMSVVKQLAWMSVFAVPLLLITSAMVEGAEWRKIPSAPAEAWAGLAYSALCSTVAAYGFWSYLIRVYPVSHIAPYSLLTPLFGVACGVLWYHEPLTALLVAGGLVTIAGVAIITVRRPRMLEFGE